MEKVVKSSGEPPFSEEKRDRRRTLWPSLEPERIFLLAVVLLGLVLGGAAFHSYDSTRLVRKALSLAQRYEREESLVSRYLLAMDDAETGQRGYLLTGDPAFLEPYTSGVRNSIALEQKIQHSLSGQMPPSKSIALLFQLAAAKRDELAQTIRLYQQGNRSAALDLLKAGKGKALMDQIRMQIHKIQGQEKVDLLIARTALSRRLRYAERDLVVAGVALGLLLWLLWRLLSISMEKKGDQGNSLNRKPKSIVSRDFPTESGSLYFCRKPFAARKRKTARWPSFLSILTVSRW